MSRVYCKNCDSEVDLKDGKCTACGNIIEENEEKEVKNGRGSITYPMDYDSIEDFDIKYNVSYFLKKAQVGETILVIEAFVLFILAFILIPASDGASLWLLVTGAILLGLAGFYANHLRWVAYMLYTNYKVMKKK